MSEPEVDEAAFDVAFDNLASVLSGDALSVVCDVVGLLAESERGEVDLRPLRAAYGAFRFERAIFELVVCGFAVRDAERSSFGFDFEMVFCREPFCAGSIAELREASRIARKLFREWSRQDAKRGRLH